MVSRNPRQPGFFMVPLGFSKMGEIPGLPVLSAYLLIMLVEHCQTRQNGGVMSVEEVRTVARSRPRGVRAIEPLVDAGILRLECSEVQQEANKGSRAGQQLVGKGTRVGQQLVKYVLTVGQEWFISGSREESILPDQPNSLRVSREQTPDRARVRVEKERKKEREGERTPSGSVRSPSAQAAPRVAGGAAQPAPKTEGSPEAEPGDTLDELGADPTRKESLAHIRKKISGSSKSTGRPAQMRRYPIELNKLSDPSPPVELNGHYQ